MTYCSFFRRDFSFTEEWVCRSSLWLKIKSSTISLSNGRNMTKISGCTFHSYSSIMLEIRTLLLIMSHKERKFSKRKIPWIWQHSVYFSSIYNGLEVCHWNSWVFVFVTRKTGENLQHTASHRWPIQSASNYTLAIIEHIFDSSYRHEDFLYFFSWINRGQSN